MHPSLFAPWGSGNIRALGLTIMLAAASVLSLFMSGGHDQQRLLQLGFLGLAVIAIAATGRAALLLRLFSGGMSGWLLLLLFGLGVASSLAAASPLHAVREVLLLALLLVVALCAAQELRANFGPGLTVVLYLLGAGCTLYVAQVGLVWLVTIVTKTPYDPYAFAPAFSNYRFLNHVQTVSLPLLVLAACRCSPSHRKLWLVLTALWAFFLVALEARGSVLGLIAGCAAALAFQRRLALPFCKKVVFAALGGLLLFFAIFDWIPRALGLAPLGSLANVVARSTGAHPTSLRDLLWKRALEYIGEQPLLGIGPAHYGRLASDLNVGSHPHDLPLQIAAEWGIPALVCLMAVTWIAARALLRQARRIEPGDTPNQLIVSALIVTGVAIMVDSLVSGLLVMPASQLAIALYTGCAAAWVWSFGPATDVQPGRFARLASAAAISAAMVGLALAAAHDARGVDPADHSAGALRHHPARTHSHPRFWVDEYFTDAELREVLACRPGKTPPCP